MSTLPPPVPAPPGPSFTNRLYDILKYVALIVLPALGTAYFSIASIWGLPAANEVVGTITVIDTFLGILLNLSTKQYEKNPDGYVVVTEDQGGTVLQNLSFPQTAETMRVGDYLRLKVVRDPNS